jgi:predicted phosphoadenosine phosphosulfate sulfurtransferase
MQEVEPKTWNRLTERLSGVNTAAHLSWSNFCPSELPYMFSSWYEYRDFLLENLVTEKRIRDLLAKEFAKDDKNYLQSIHKAMITRHINAILTNDVDLSRMGTWRAAHLNFRVRKVNNDTRPSNQ